MSISFAAIVARKQSNPSSHLIEKDWEATPWRNILARYNADLGIVAIIYLVVVVAAIASTWYFFTDPQAKSADPSKIFPIVFSTAVFGTFVELIRRTVDLAFKRLTTIDLFASEILSILRVFAAANIVGEFVRHYQRLTEAHSRLDAPGEHSSGMGFADSARKESYFSIFEKNSAELGSLGSATVHNVTAFYTFLKGARDATGAIQLWEKPGYETSQKQADIVSIIHLCFLMTVHGHEALKALIPSEINREIALDILAGVQLQCFAFLDAVLRENDYRREKLQQRRAACAALRMHYEYEIGPQ